MKLWQKNNKLNKNIEKYTVGDDYILDKRILKFDCIASKAHVKVLFKAGILNESEKNKLIEALDEILKLDEKDKFIIEQEDEDCHTAIENYLTNKLGDLGKKIHTARSRNDQVLTALRLYEKYELDEIEKEIKELIKSLQSKINKFGNIEIPGYTHMQKAMPSSIKLWLGAYLSAFEDDLKILKSTRDLIDQSPLGTAAGYGVPVFAIDRKLSANEMKFSKVMENPIYAQLSRGKFESNIINLLTLIMYNLNRLSSDMILFSMKEFNYIKLPIEFCTGSSIMPQKKNPDVLELMRANYHVVLGEEMKVKGIMGNLISGYNRDMQLTKAPIINSLDITKDTLKISVELINEFTINQEVCKKAMSEELYATEEAYKLVKKGIPFREAYKKISEKFN